MAVAPPPQGEFELRPAVAADAPALGELYAAAFAGNAAYRWIFSGAPDLPAPVGALAWLFSRRAAMLLQCGSCPLMVAARAADGALVAAGGVRPFTRKPTLWQFVRHGIFAWPLWWGLASLKRGLRLDGDLAAMLRPGGALHGRGVEGEVVLMAVHPGCQGQGQGNRLLAALLDTWDTSGGEGGTPGGGLVLSTQEDYAVRLYRRHGFLLVAADSSASEGGPQGEAGAVTTEGGYDDWYMYRLVAAGAATTVGAGEGRSQ